MAAPQNFVSVSRRQLDFEDYIDIVRRHRSWIIGPTWAGLVASVVIALFWPSTYESSAFMRITPQVVSERMVPDVVSQATAQRLQSLKTQVLGRGSLGSIINDKKLYPKIVKDYSLEDAIEQMVKDIKVTADVQATGDRSFATSVQIRFAYTDRFKARDVVQALTSGFVNANLAFQKTSASGTAKFIGDQLQEAKIKLDEVNDLILAFRTENKGKLPEQAASNGQRLGMLQNQISQSSDRINNLELQKNSLQTALEGRNDILNLLTKVADESGSAQTVRNQKLINLDTAIRNQQLGLTALKEKYTPDWPAVKEAEAQLKVLKDEEAREQAALADDPAASPRAQAQKNSMDLQRQAQFEAYKNEIKAIQRQMDNADIQIQQITKDRADLLAEAKVVSAKIDESPAIEQQYAALERDRQLAQERFNTLKKEDDVSQMSKDLQDKGQGELLELADPANLPMNPSKPNRWAIAAGGTGIGLLIGFVFAGAREAQSTSLKNLKDVRAYANMAVLSSIPLLENALLVRRKRRLLWLGWSTAVMIGLCAMGAALWYYYLGGVR
jgi:polysaccharide biosynthesis transport protein